MTTNSSTIESKIQKNVVPFVSHMSQNKNPINSFIKEFVEDKTKEQFFSDLFSKKEIDLLLK